MIVCQCKNAIQQAVVVAHRPLSTCNKENRPLVVSDGLHFVCETCAKKIVSLWENHNEGRTEPYLIQKININVQANTKKDFSKRVLPQIINQFKNISPCNWYIPKKDINNALKNKQTKFN